MKNRRRKAEEYEDKYSHIPLDIEERLSWLYDELKITDKKADEIILKRDAMIQSLYFETIKIILYEEPEGSPRPRFRLINRQNLSNSALSNPNFVHVYSITGAEDNRYLQRRLMTEGDFVNIQGLLWSPCDVEFNTFSKTPNSFNATDKILAEIGLIRPLTKPDWDNIGKKYSDMFNNNIWLDDTLVIDGTVRKFYSALPRIEINLRYMNMLYNKYQYNSISSRCNSNINFFGREDLKNGNSGIK